jgi:hypothetical protein
MTINFGVESKTERDSSGKPRVEYSSIEIEADWDSDEDHEKIMTEIHKLYPDSRILGYYLAYNNYI